MSASAMKRDYTIYPSMIGSEGGIMWYNGNIRGTFPFDDAHPLFVSTLDCKVSSICVWNVSPV